MVVSLHNELSSISSKAAGHASTIFAQRCCIWPVTTRQFPKLPRSARGSNYNYGKYTLTFRHQVSMRRSCVISTLGTNRAMRGRLQYVLSP